MNKQLLYILSLIGLLSFAACTNEDSPMQNEGTGEIRFAVVDTASVEIPTRSTLYFDEEAIKEFRVSLKRGDTSLFTNKRYGDIAGTTFTCAVSEDYVLTAENCTEAEAESANQSWGQVRMYGEENFAVATGESKTVTVNCGMANSSVEVDFSNFIESMFPTYSIELHATDDADRTFTFNETNYRYRKAYFNVSETGRQLSYTVNLPSPYKGPYSGTLALSPSKCYTLSIKVKGDTTSTTVTLGVTVDETLLEEIPLTEKINPYQ
nr:DUF4493 domain-containing protein [uncultured Bacteroides sp.]